MLVISASVGHNDGSRKAVPYVPKSLRLEQFFSAIALVPTR
jgi:hypothetical protein